jgi:FKBP-type peptidyl-prolyl cis-trans isomerase 2
MGEKKQKEERMRKVKQIVVVGACVLFVILMILSGMGSHWLTMFTVTKPGDTVVVDYTLYDAAGSPIMTSNQQLYKNLAASGKGVILSRQLSMISGQKLGKEIYPVPIYTTASATQQFALFSTEYDAISSALIGMKTGDQKHIPIPSNLSMTQTWSAAQLQRNNVNMSDLNVGDMLAMGVSDNPEAMISNTSTITYTRMGEVVSKTNASVVVDFGYPSADISVVSINANS